MTTQATLTDAPAADAPRGWNDLNCPFCGGTDCVVARLCDGALICDSCGELDLAEVRRHAERWLAVLRWLSQLPAVTP